MTADTATHSVREAVGVFEDEASLQQAALELMETGFDRASLSLLAGESAIEEKLGHMYDRAAEVEDDPSVLTTAFVQSESIGAAEGAALGALIYIPALTAIGAVVATGGALAAAVLAAAYAGGAGGLLGMIAANWIDDHHAHYLQEQLDRGGLLLWVRTFNADEEKRAVDILSRHSAHDVHVHGLPG